MSVVEATAAQDLLQQLRKFTFNAVDSEADETEQISPWPLMKKITFGLDSTILNEGVILVDLPGAHDVNRVRSRTIHLSFTLRACKNNL